MRKFNCSTKTLGEYITVSPKQLVVIEGVYSMHPDLREYYDFSVFLKISDSLQKERILHRNSASHAQCFFQQWIPLEKNYYSQMRIEERCNMIISTDITIQEATNLLLTD